MDIESDIDNMLADSPVSDAEEWAIHDHEGFCGVKLSEHADLEDISDIAALIGEHGVVAGALLAYHGLDEAKRLMEEGYQGEHDSLTDWVNEYLESTGELDSIPEHLRYYFDVEAYARDCELTGGIFTVTTPDGQVHVFSNY